MKLTQSTKLTHPTVAQTITLDATGQSVGRLATRVAVYLRGKHQATFSPIKFADIKVVINNAAKLNINPKVMVNKQYRRYTGYPGGVKYTPLSDLFKKDPAKIIRLAVARMLPRNHLRIKYLRNLIINK